MPALSTLTTTQTVTLSVLNINQTVTPFALITATGGTTPLLYSITPGIFTGLNFSTSTGIITGTPTTLILNPGETAQFYSDGFSNNWIVINGMQIS